MVCVVLEWNNSRVIVGLIMAPIACGNVAGGSNYIVTLGCLLIHSDASVIWIEITVLTSAFTRPNNYSRNQNETKWGYWRCRNVWGRLITPTRGYPYSDNSWLNGEATESHTYAFPHGGFLKAFDIRGCRSRGHTVWALQLGGGIPVG